MGQGCKDAEDGAAGKEEKRKAKEEVYGCGARGHARGWHEQRNVQTTGGD